MENHDPALNVCAMCGEPVDRFNSPSDDFCREICQNQWHINRANKRDNIELGRD